MKCPLISIIIPGYNIERYVEKCLQSLQGQSYRNIEVILIDDGSEDCTGKIFDKYAKLDSRFKAIHQKNQGVSAARNLGLAMANGEWICFVDGDDYLDINTFENIMLEIADYNVDAVMFEYCITYPNGNIERHNSQQRYGILKNEEAMNNIYTCAPFCCAKIFRRTIVNDVKFRQNIYRGEDTIFAVEAFKKAKKIYSTEKKYYYYVQSEGSAVRGGLSNRQLTGIDAFKWLLDFSIKYYPELKAQALINYINIMIEFYIEMEAEKYININAKKRILQQTKKYKQEVMKIVSGKQKIKFKMFYIWPFFFGKCINVFRRKMYKING